MVEDGDKWARFDPFDGFKVDFTIAFDHPLFKGSQSARGGQFLHHILSSRKSAGRAPSALCVIWNICASGG
jgi:UDP-3-O-acyl-N-acetylglucosamine deacetylase